jgi:hypothetical protein
MSGSTRIAKPIRTQVTTDKNNPDLKRCTAINLTDTTKPTDSSECGSDISIVGLKTKQHSKKRAHLNWMTPESNKLILAVKFQPNIPI